MRVSRAWVALVASAVGVVTACSPGDVELQATPPVTTSTDSTASSTDPVGTTPHAETSTDSTTYGDGDTLSREEWALMYWMGEGDAPPVIREVSREEQLEVEAACLIDRGFPVFGDADGRGMRSEAGSADQAEVYFIAFYECQAQYPLEPKYYQPYNDAQLTAWYEHLIDETTPCLTAQGYTVTEPAPSVEVWINGYRTGTSDWWHPVFDAVSEALQNDIHDVCPTQPDNFFDLATPVD